jgi:hypothetical protein
MKSVRKRLTYANVMSSIAVFLVVAGGTAFAASQLGKESVGAKQLKKEAVGLAKINKAAKSSLKGATGPAGPAGAKGATGDKGATGAKGEKGEKGDRGPSAGLSVRGGSAISWTGADQTLVSLSLAPGNWIITTKTTVVNNEAAEKTFRCELRVNETVIDRNHAGVVGVPLPAGGRTTTALTNGISVTGTSPATLVCTSIGATTGFFVEPTMTAIQVGTLNGA